METNFSNITGVIFDFDCLYSNKKDLFIRVYLSDLLHAKWIRTLVKTRESFKEKTFKNQKAFYEELFLECSKNLKASPDKLRKWYFTRFIPNLCNNLNSYCTKNEYIDEIFSKLKEKKFPFYIYDEYFLSKARAKSIGILNTDDLIFYSTEEMFCTKNSTKSFEEISDSLISRKDDKNEILFVTSDKKTYKEAKNFGFSLVKITRGKTKKEKTNWKDFSKNFLQYLENCDAKEQKA